MASHRDVVLLLFVLLSLLPLLACAQSVPAPVPASFVAGFRRVLVPGNYTRGESVGVARVVPADLAVHLQFTSPDGYAEFYLGAAVFHVCDGGNSVCTAAAAPSGGAPRFFAEAGDAFDTPSSVLTARDGRQCPSRWTKPDPAAAGGVLRLWLDGADALCRAELQNGAYYDFFDFQLSPAEVVSAPPHCALPSCDSVADVIFVLDESGSISPTAWRDLRLFAVNTVRALGVAPSGVHVAAVSFSETARTVMPFTSDQAAAETQLGQLLQARGWTCIPCGIEEGLTLLPNTLRPAGAPAVPRIMIVLTDGHNNVRSNDFGTVLAQGAAAQIEFFAVGVVGYSLSELMLITGQRAERVFEVQHWAALSAIIDSLMGEICQALPTSTCPAQCLGVCTCRGECACPDCSAADAPCAAWACNASAPLAGCAPQPPPACSDGDACTTDSCDPQATVAGGCVHTPIPGCTSCNTTGAGVCDDGDACTVDACVGLPEGVCTHTPLNCSVAAPADLCTVFVRCNSSFATCVFAARDCGDGDNCTLDLCDPLLGCSNPPIADCCTAAADCNDLDACTVDACVGMRCTNTPVVCVPVDACHTAACGRDGICMQTATVCPDDGDPCTQDVCNRTTGACGVPVPRCGAQCSVDGDCDDRLNCTRDYCAGGVCLSEYERCAQTNANAHACAAAHCDTATNECVRGDAPCDCIDEIVGFQFAGAILGGYFSSDVNVISFGTFASGPGDVEGRLFVGGDLRLSGNATHGFSVGWSVKSADTPDREDRALPWTLVVGGNVSWVGSGAVFPDGVRNPGPKEGIYVGGSIEAMEPYLRADVTGGPGDLREAFASAYAYFMRLSDTLAAMEPNVNVTYQWDGVHLTSDNPHSARYYIRIPAPEFSDATWWTMTGMNPDAVFVVTVDGDGPVVFKGGNFPGPRWTRTIFNIRGARDVVVLGDVAGNLLAPDATLRQRAADERGLVIVGAVLEFIESWKPNCTLRQITTRVYATAPDPCAVAILTNASRPHCLACTEFSPACRYCFGDDSCRAVGHPLFGECCSATAGGVGCAFGNGSKHTGGQGLCPSADDAHQCATGDCCLADRSLAPAGTECQAATSCFDRAVCDGAGPLCLRTRTAACTGVAVGSGDSSFPDASAGWARMVLQITVDAVLDFAAARDVVARLYGVLESEVVILDVAEISATNGVFEYRVVCDIALKPGGNQDSGWAASMTGNGRPQAVGLQNADLVSWVIGPDVVSAAPPAIRLAAPLCAP